MLARKNRRSNANPKLVPVNRRETVRAARPSLTLGTSEMLTVTGTHRADRPALFTTFFLVIPIQYGLIWAGRYDLFAVFVPAYAFLVLPILAALSSDTKDFLARTAAIQSAVLLCVYGISYLPALLMLNIRGYEEHNLLLIAFFLIVAQSSDVLQYIFGKLMGRHKIAPLVSPSKTTEGLLGGLTGSALIGAGLVGLTPFRPLQAAFVALTISLSGFLGGLVLSAIKRDHRVKDWGHLISGHGGVLDRVDSICFAAPVFFYLTRCFL